MAADWYYLVEGRICGPIKQSEMRKLATQGEITPSTRIRRDGQVSWFSAGILSGLFPDGATETKQSASSRQVKSDAEWHLRDITGRMFGPVPKTQLDDWFRDGQISGDCQIRHVGWREWRGASEVFPDLNEGAIDWGNVWDRFVRICSVALDRVKGYFARLTIRWSPSPPHLRRCINKISHCQFSTHAACVYCGDPTVGRDIVNFPSFSGRGVRVSWGS